eukprot:TRINITY_DN7590_c0_g1_i3.p2 TRINITY_DN7590_c0_g1~~TRINITY_DN7590_c0_g1_i3.p2  ORF type:complete len:225 (+),score=-16.54 TRINITY_DN7590_c0_g1_i3:168-842(+)
MASDESMIVRFRLSRGSGSDTISPACSRSRRWTEMVDLAFLVCSTIWSNGTGPSAASSRIRTLMGLSTAITPPFVEKSRTSSACIPGVGPCLFFTYSMCIARFIKIVRKQQNIRIITNNVIAMKAESFKIADGVYWVGSLDWDLRTYHGYTLDGTSYNCYLVFGEKTVLIDNVLSLIHISEPTRLGMISYAVFCLKKKKSKLNEQEEKQERRETKAHDEQEMQQ